MCHCDDYVGRAEDCGGDLCGTRGPRAGRPDDFARFADDASQNEWTTMDGPRTPRYGAGMTTAWPRVRARTEHVASSIDAEQIEAEALRVAGIAATLLAAARDCAFTPGVAVRRAKELLAEARRQCAGA